MNKYPCDLIEDLIPLYIENDVSDTTKKIIENHVNNCEKCASLINEYSNDDIKLQSFNQDLPQANTYKKWMKKLKVFGIIIFTVAVFSAISIGLFGYKIGEKSKNDLLTLKTIVKTFEKQGIPLKKSSIKSSNEFELDGVNPAVFTIGESKDTLLVYTFKSFVERDDIVKKSNKFNNIYSLQECSFNAKNAFLVYIASKNPSTDEEMQNLSKTKTLVSDIVFKYLNDGKEIVYKGESPNWQGTFTLKYYEHWYQDESGKFYHETYSTESPMIKYKNTDIETVGPVDFEYKTSAGQGKTTETKLNKKGLLDIGTISGNTAIPQENEEITCTINWNNKKENITLKSK